MKVPAAFAAALIAKADELGRPLEPHETRALAAEHGLTVADLAAWGVHVPEVRTFDSLTQLRDVMSALPGGAEAFERVTADLLAGVHGPQQPARLDS